MQTFLPYEDFTQCARVLDNKRLGKQRVECLQILNALRPAAPGEKRGWANHPAVRMWRGYEGTLARYAAAMVVEWRNVRGFNDTTGPKISDLLHAEFPDANWENPPWLGDSRVHISHRANLVRKDPEHYGPLWPDVEPAEGYYWPVGLAHGDVEKGRELDCEQPLSSALFASTVVWLIHSTTC